MSEIDKNYNKTFEEIKHIDENGIEFWYARELQLVLDYKEWRKFENVINKARVVENLHTIIKNMLSEHYDVYFAEPAMSADNAVGIAALALRAFKSEQEK